MVELTDADVGSLARAATGRERAVVAWEVVPAAPRVANLTTAALERIRGMMADGSVFSVVVKTLHPASSSPMWGQIPEMFRESVLEDLNWLDEPRVYRSGLSAGLPSGLRMPAVYRIDETPSTISLYLEDLADSATWDDARYCRSARVLGRLSARWPHDRAVVQLAAPTRRIARLFFGKIVNFDMQLMAADAFWEQPDIARVADSTYRRDLERLAQVMPGLLARLETMPHALVHGDAAPDNLREPGDGVIAAIDWSYASLAPVGSDLGQLLSGRVEVEGRSRDESRRLFDAVVDEYVAGFEDEKSDVDRAEVVEACITYLAARFVFSALLLDAPSDTADHERLTNRAVLGRLGLDLALDLAANVDGTSDR